MALAKQSMAPGRFNVNSYQLAPRYELVFEEVSKKYKIRIPMDWKDLDSQSKTIPQRLVEHFGKRTGERLFAEGENIITNVEYNVSRTRMDLSHTTQAN